METTVKIFSCTQSENLSKKIAQVFGQSLGSVEFQRYSDGEFQPSFEESVRGSRVFIIGSTNPSSDNLMEMLLMLDAAKRASARHITAVIPYFGWARQDRKDKPRVPIGAKLIAKLIESAGATRIITMDLHAGQIQGFFEKPVDHLYASSIFVPYIQSLKIDNLTIASPDMGGSKRAYAYSKFLNSDVVICYKERSKGNIITHMELIGDVSGKNVILIDDMVDTAGTIAKAADLMIERGALSVIGICTHALLSGDAYEKIENSKLDKLVITDSIDSEKQSNKIEVLSCSKIFVRSRLFDLRKPSNATEGAPTFGPLILEPSCSIFLDIPSNKKTNLLGVEYDLLDLNFILNFSKFSMKSLSITILAFFCKPEGISSLNNSKKNSDIVYFWLSNQTDPAPLARSLILEM